MDTQSTMIGGRSSAAAPWAPARLGAVAAGTGRARRPSRPGRDRRRQPVRADPPEEGRDHRSRAAEAARRLPLLVLQLDRRRDVGRRALPEPARRHGRRRRVAAHDDDDDDDDASAAEAGDDRDDDDGDRRRSGRIVLVRNHEGGAGAAYVDRPARHHLRADRRRDGNGGTTNLVFDTRRGEWEAVVVQPRRHDPQLRRRRDAVGHAGSPARRPPTPGTAGSSTSASARATPRRSSTWAASRTRR